ncbi:hypothetical protein BDF19DRAFT_163439 [Syncephalis fuscata]|nr:hypothetical protein BDF19DRAFT_163439 [Syncephalis fuscata]
MTRWFTSIVVASVGYAVLVTGNIEKVEFTGEMYTIDSTLWHRVNEQLSHLSIWPLLTPPYTFYGEQSIVPSDTDVDRVLLEHYTSDKQHNEAALLIQDTKLTERWYLLENITQGERYECRISYGATTPTDFVMSLLRYDQVGNLLFAEESDKSDTIESKIETSRLILRVQAIHAGVSNQPELSKRPVPYNIGKFDHLFLNNELLLIKPI